jgi:hypothetical protein
MGFYVGSRHAIWRLDQLGKPLILAYNLVEMLNDTHARGLRTEKLQPDMMRWRFIGDNVGLILKTG